jgi:hypothetical protein
VYSTVYTISGGFDLGTCECTVQYSTVGYSTGSTVQEVQCIRTTANHTISVSYIKENIFYGTEDGHPESLRNAEW